MDLKFAFKCVCGWVSDPVLIDHSIVTMMLQGEVVIVFKCPERTQVSRVSSCEIAVIPP